MNLSTRLKRDLPPDILSSRAIKMMVDCGKKEIKYAPDLATADAIHKEFLSRGYQLLPKETVVNSIEIVIHYTSTTYKDWCNN